MITQQPGPMVVIDVLRAYDGAMPVFIDDQATTLPGDTVAQVMQQAQTRITDQGRMIVEVQLDGRTLVDDALDHASELPMADAELRLYTADPATLCIESLEQARPRLDQAQQLTQQASELLQQDQTPTAMQHLGEILAVWQQVQQVVSHVLALSQIDPEALTVDGETAQQMIHSLVERFEEMREQVVAGDAVALADALAYEWPETAGKWQQLIDAMIHQLSQAE